MRGIFFLILIVWLLVSPLLVFASDGSVSLKDPLKDSLKDPLNEEILKVRDHFPQYRVHFPIQQIRKEVHEEFLEEQEEQKGQKPKEKTTKIPDTQ